MNEEEKETYQDSFSIGTAATTGALKVYLDMVNLEVCELKLKNFFKLRKFINQIKEL